MGKTEKPKSSWQERKKDIKHKSLTPFIYIEWLCERLSYRLEQWAFLDILGRLGHLSIVVSLIVGVSVYLQGRSERRMKAESERIQAENQRRAKHYQAWQIINAAQGQSGSGGRIDALQDLNNDKVSLESLDLSNANLKGIDLKGADLREASFYDADLVNANLSGADLSGAILYGADLSGADLSRADLSKADLTLANLQEANLSRAYLKQADLMKIGKWKDVNSIGLANIYSVRNEPNGFIKWAKEKGALEIEARESWEVSLKLLPDKTAPRITNVAPTDWKPTDKQNQSVIITVIEPIDKQKQKVIITEIKPTGEQKQNVIIKEIKPTDKQKQ